MRFSLDLAVFVVKLIFLLQIIYCPHTKAYTRLGIASFAQSGDLPEFGVFRSTHQMKSNHLVDLDRLFFFELKCYFSPIEKGKQSGYFIGAILAY